MKNLSSVMQELIARDTVFKTERKVELIQLGQQDLLLGSFRDEGRAGDQTMAYALAKWEGDTYVGVGANGHVYRIDATDTYVDCGQPGGNNAVLCLFVFESVLYCGTDFNAKVYKYNGGTSWTDCGSPGGANQDVNCLTEFNASLIAGTKNGHVYSYVSPSTWNDMGRPTPTSSWIKDLKVYNDELYAGLKTTGGEGHVGRYVSGTTWSDLGWLGSSSIVNCLEVLNESLYAGVTEAPTAGLYLYGGGTTWTEKGFPGVLTPSIWCLKEYGNKLYAGTVKANDGRLYYYIGGTNWTDLGQLGSCGGVYSLAENNYRFYAGTGTEARVFSAGLVGGIDISEYLEKGSPGMITQRVENLVNQFQPGDIAIACEEPKTIKVFFKDDGSGLFDPDKIEKGYQVKVSVGVDGCEDWILSFDGKVEKTPERPTRDRASFVGMGWLDNAKNFNAELVADPNNPALKNISGVIISSVGDSSQVGAKNLKLTMNAADEQELSFESGERVNVSAGGDFDLFDSLNESNIAVNVDDTQLPTEDCEDSFTIIESGGLLKAVGWYENKTLEFIVEKLLTEIGTTEQDIKVEEIESLISDEKNFIMLSKWFPSSSPADPPEITALKLVDVDVPTTTITLLVGVKISTTDNHYHMLQINYETGGWVEVDKNSFGEHQVLRFFKFANAWWILLGYTVAATPWFPNDPWRYVATYLKKIDANFDVDYTFPFSSIYPNLPPRQFNICNETLWKFALAKSGSILDHAGNDIYFIECDRPDVGNYDCSLIKLVWGGTFLTRTFIKLLETDDSTTNLVMCDDWASMVPRSTDDFCYYGIRKTASPNALDIIAYAITLNTFSTVKQDTTNGGIENFTRNIQSASFQWQGYFAYPTAAGRKAYWIGNTGLLNELVFPEQVENLIYANPLFERYYIYWHYEDGFYQIKTIDSLLGLWWKEDEKLDVKYSLSHVAPVMWYEGEGQGDWWFAGIMQETGDKSLVPFLYKPGKVPMIDIADFTGKSCEQALTEFAKVYLCAYAIYERFKARFYFRESFNDTATLDSEDYDLDPQVEYWDNKIDGVVIQNSKRGIIFRVGNTGKGADKIEIDSVFINSRGHAKIVANWLYTFFSQKRLLVTVKIPFGIQYELFDKINLTLRNIDGTIFRSFNTIVYEMSFNPSPETVTTHDVYLKLLQLDGIPERKVFLFEEGAAMVVT